MAGYQVRAAKLPITRTNFDDATATTVVPYTTTPAAVGQPDGVVTQALYIETGYYFAVRAVDAAGSKSEIATTNAAAAAHFNQTTIVAPGTAEQFGRSISADGDLNGDNISDIAVGTLSAGKAYLYLGGATLASTPSVVFTGASTGFGFTVAQIGDIDHDGLQDLAIADSQSALKVYIYKGRASWPAALADTDANYVISTDLVADPNYAASFFGFSMARLGDFTGDSVDDFAIGARGYANGVGRVVIISGKATGFASVSLPDATKAITIDGDGTVGRPFFGYRVLGLGPFSTGATGTLVVSAPGSVTSAPADIGRVYVFQGQPGTGGAISLSSAASSVGGPAEGARIGLVLSPLGKMFNGFPGVAIGNLTDTTDIPGGHGGAYLMSGTSPAGLFANNQIAYVAAGVSASGGVLVGGGLPGSNASVSLIGDGTPDLVMAGEIGTTLTISDGAKIGAKASPNQLDATAEVTVSLPAAWNSGEGNSGIIKDINGDGVADFCLGSQLQPGGVLVFW